MVNSVTRKTKREPKEKMLEGVRKRKKGEARLRKVNKRREALKNDITKGKKSTPFFYFLELPTPRLYVRKRG